MSLEKKKSVQQGCCMVILLWNWDKEEIVIVGDLRLNVRRCVTENDWNITIKWYIFYIHLPTEFKC